MIVVTVARKPVIGTVARNSIEFGSGGINIDASRLATNEVRNYQTRRKPSPGADARTAIFGGGKGPGEHINPPHPGGRFPSNIIFEHQPECQLQGAKTVKASAPMGKPSMGTENHGMFSNGSVRLAYGDTGNGYGNGDGTETVQAWDCTPECPVAILDGQSGECPSGGLKPHLEQHNSATSYRLTRGIIDYHKEPDTGGASRYFYQVGGCVPGCPVAALDDQSGERPVSGAAHTGNDNKVAGRHDGSFLSSIDGYGVLHNDSGTASRYFKQVGGL